jgi:hypothetical protein
MKDNERSETFSDLEVKVPLQQAPTKEIRTSALMTDDGTRSFPTGSDFTTKAFEGAQGTDTLEEWMEGKKAPARPRGDELPWMGRV